MKAKHIEPIPEEFASLREASDFWDSHDAGEYMEYLRPVKEKVTVDEDQPQVVLLEHSLSERLKLAAHQSGVSLETLVNLWLKEKLQG